MDGTEDGYLEYCALYLLGNHFYQFWHSHYEDTELISNEQALKRLFGKRYSPLLPLPKDLYTKAKSLDLSPAVSIREDATVSIVTFSKWRGFERHEIKIKITAPHKIIKDKTTMLIFYNIPTSY
jgi:hypothetical protein